MLDLLGMIATRQRPPLLVRAARYGVDTYNRSQQLPRLLASAKLPRFGEAILRLLDIEAEYEARRIGRSAEYSVAKHVAVLTALMGEARLLRVSNTDRQPGNTGSVSADLIPFATARPGVARAAAE